MAKSEAVLVGGIPLKVYLGKKKSEEVRCYYTEEIGATRRLIQKIRKKLKIGDHCKYDQTPGPVRYLTDTEIIKEYGQMPAKTGMDTVRRTLVAFFTMTRDGTWVTNAILSDKLNISKASMSAITSRIVKRMRDEIDEEPGEGKTIKRRLKSTCSLTQEAFIDKFYKRKPKPKKEVEVIAKKKKKKKARAEAAAAGAVPPTPVGLDPMKLIEEAVNEVKVLKADVTVAIEKMDTIYHQAQALYERSERILQNAIETPINTGTDLNLNLGGEAKIRIFVHLIMGSKE